jgi:hypothetical protein
LVSATVGVRMTKDRFRRNRSPQKSEMPSRAVMARKLSANLYKDKCSLETLRMKQNHIGDHADVVFVFEVYLASSYCSLKCLDVSYNGIGPTVGKALGVAMRLNRQLLEVVARWNDLEGSNSTIANGLRDNDRLLSLDLAYTAFGNSSAMVLAKSLKFATSNLRSLLLAENTIGPVGCNALCRALQINKNVQMIDLTGNPIEEQGLVAVSRLLKNNSILEYVGLDLLRTNVKLGMYGAGARDAPPGTPPVDKNVVRALQRIRRDERVVGDGGIGPFKLFQDVHSTSFIVSPRWIDEGISEVDLHAAKKFHLSGVEVTGEDDVYGFHNESLLRPTRHPFQRSNYPDVQRVVVHDVRAAGDAERLPVFPREPFLASMVGDQQSWGEDRLLVHFPASVGPKIDIKSKGPRAGEAQNYRCQVTLVNSIEGPGLRYSVTQLFHTRVESLLPAGSRAASRQGWRSKVVKNKPVTTEIIPMAVLAREDDFEDEYEAKEDIDDEEMEEALLHANLGSLVIGSEEEEEGPVVPGEPGRMRKLGLEFVWPTKYLPDVSVGSIVCFEFKTIETHGIKREGVSSIPYLNNIYTNQVERYGIEKPPIVPVEKEEDTESEEEEESNSRYGRSRGSTRSSARSGQSSRRSNRKK